MAGFFRYLRALACLGRWLDLFGRASLATIVLVPLLSVLLLVSTGGKQLHLANPAGALAATTVAVVLFTGGNVAALRSDLGTTGRRRLRFYGFGLGDYLGLVLLASFLPTVVESLCLAVLFDAPLPYPGVFLSVFVSTWLLSAGVFLFSLKAPAKGGLTPPTGVSPDCPTSPGLAVEFYLWRALGLPARRGVFPTAVWLVAAVLGGVSVGLRLPQVVSYFMSGLLTGGVLEYMLAAEWQLPARTTWQIYAVDIQMRNRAKLRAVLRIVVPYLACTLAASLLATRSGWVSMDALLVLILVAGYALVNTWGLTRVLSATAQRQGRRLSDFQVALWLILNLVPLLILLLAFGTNLKEKTRGEKRRHYAQA